MVQIPSLTCLVRDPQVVHDDFAPDLGANAGVYTQPYHGVTPWAHLLIHLLQLLASLNSVETLCVLVKNVILQ